MKLDIEILRELSKLADNERTILSVYLDLSRGWDKALDYMYKEKDRVIVLLNNNEKEFFETSWSFFMDEVKDLKSRDFKAPGLAFFADLGAAYSKTLRLDIAPVPLVAVDDEAILHPLAFMLDEYERVGVIMVDASGARILIATGEVLSDAATLRTKIHHLSKVGGWSQMRYQRRRAKQVQQFSRQIVESAYRIFTEENVRRAGLNVERVESLAPLDLVKLIIAHPTKGSQASATGNSQA